MTQYILRFDDITPEFLTTNTWKNIDIILKKFNLKAILAVIPFCEDKEIICKGNYKKGLEILKALQKEGHMIGMHGCHHKLVRTKSNSLVPINNYGEFAGKSREKQLELIKKSYEWFKNQEIDPKLWVAPAHNFDKNTLYCLKRIKINIISDGIFLGPRMRNGFIWLPQQIWKLRELPIGCWTICIHPTNCDSILVNDLREFLLNNIVDFKNPSQVVNDLNKITKFSFLDQIMQDICIKILKLKRLIKLIFIEN